jgi:hypothetical protein
MRVSVRLDLISRIGRELQNRYTFSELYSYLSAFKVPKLEDGPTDSKWSYVKAVLDNQSNDIIIEIANDLEIDVPESIASSASTNERILPRIWEGSSNFRLFISHLAKNKDKAIRLKETLEYYSISGFVAHEDIDPTLEWQAEIERGLYAMDAMVTIHTKGFSTSYWTQQEIGFALGRNKKVISLKMDEDPTGFISKHQALSRRNRKAEEIAAEINDLLQIDAQTNRKLKNAQSKSHSPPIQTVQLSPELTTALQRQHEIDIEGAGPKAPVQGFIYKGVHIESRWGVESELETMKLILEALAEPVVRKLSYIWCDSKAGSTYSISVQSGKFDHELRDAISDAIMSTSGGHNGVFFEDGEKPSFGMPIDNLDPDWPEGEDGF